VDRQNTIICAFVLEWWGKHRAPPSFPTRRSSDLRPLVLTAERQVKRLASVDFPVPVEALERMRIPKSFNPRSPQSRRDGHREVRSEEHTSELQSRENLVCRLLLGKKKKAAATTLS